MPIINPRLFYAFALLAIIAAPNHSAAEAAPSNSASHSPDCACDASAESTPSALEYASTSTYTHSPTAESSL